MIKVLEEQMWTEEGINKNPVNDQGKSHWRESWIDEIKLMMKSRNIVACSNQNRELSVTKNKNIIEHARIFAENIEDNNEILTIINHVRMFKKLSYHAN